LEFGLLAVVENFRVYVGVNLALPHLLELLATAAVMLAKIDGLVWLSPMRTFPA
jgi:hypothetical protein